MQYSTVFISALAAFASASPLQARADSADCLAAAAEVPACGAGCIETASAAAGYISYTTMCANFQAIRTASALCIITTCNNTAITTAVLAKAEAACKVCI